MNVRTACGTYTDSVQAAVRWYTREYVNNNKHLCAKEIKRDEVIERCAELKSNWPIKRGNFTAIVHAVFEEARYKYDDHEERPV